MEGSIPEIDVLKVERKPKKLREVGEKWGCFRVVNHGVPLKLLADMKSAVGQLHDLPLEVKQQNVDVIPGSGYVAPSEKNPLYESLGLFDVASSASVSTFCSQLRVSPQQRYM
ncbi:2-oxoglutarate-dependent dioxygenase DAO-like [Chenopodium quinoa]|uniref:2-oxoglutarate-dependent dioxygenase DAO-like n=1 Tax=Chenopodium quinoa TaxID=63459 RepID=UPI000B780B2B|nr:2-oxoglutarate-dependent dioxygenase DAO-like [Chenopodium quinoa]